MTTVTDIYDQINDAGVLFKVREEPILSTSGVNIPGKKAIIRDDSNEYLGVVGKNYRVVTNSEVIDRMLKTLEKSDLDLTDAYADVTTSHAAARSMVNVVMPAHSFQVEGDSSKTALQISTLNSYDGRWKFQSRGGAIRMACANGQIVGDFIGSYTRMHNKSLNIDHAAEHMVTMLQNFHQAKDWWSQMMKTPVDEKLMLRVSAKFIADDMNLVKKNEDKEQFMKRATYKELERLYTTYSKEFGANAYALYNALTDYATHGSAEDREKSKRKTNAEATLKAQEKLSTILRLPVFAKAD